MFPKRNKRLHSVIESQESNNVVDKVLTTFSKQVRMTVRNDLAEGVMVGVRESNRITRSMSLMRLKAGVQPFAYAEGEVNMENTGKEECIVDTRYIPPFNETTFVVTNGKEQIVSVQTENKTVFEGRRVVGGHTRTLRILNKHVPP